MRTGMTQLILDVDGLAVAMPETRMGKYRAYRDAGYEDVEMVTRRLTRELRGDIWVVEYQYEYYKRVMKNRVLAACKKGQHQPILCSFLPPESDGELIDSRFFVTKLTPPKFYWSKSEYGESIPLWGEFSLTLREVNPSD